MTTAKCLICGQSFRTYPSIVAKGGGKYCSQSCYRSSGTLQLNVVKMNAHNRAMVVEHGGHGWMSPKARERHRQSIVQRNHDPRYKLIGAKNPWFGKVPPCVNAGTKGPRWKGGRKKTSAGYIYKLAHGHPRATKAGYVLEHTLVMEEYLGRPLDYEGGERVHHCNQVRDDNRIENLELILLGEHTRMHWKMSPPSRPSVTPQLISPRLAICHHCGSIVPCAPSRPRRYCSRACLTSHMRLLRAGGRD